MYGWCVTEGAPVKPCIHAKIHFTSTALISLQPEAHKLPQCVWSWWTNAAYGHCWGVGYTAGHALCAQPTLECCRWCLWVTSIEGGTTRCLYINKKWQGYDNLCACLISWVHVGKCLHIAACFMSDVSVRAHVPALGCSHSCGKVC